MGICPRKHKIVHDYRVQTLRLGKGEEKKKTYQRRWKDSADYS